MAEGPVVAVIPAGGAGTRLWPLSRRTRPKHALALSGSGLPLLVETFRRLEPLVDLVVILTEAAQADLVRQNLPQLKPEQLLVEPTARGTTNALALAAEALWRRHPESVMVSLAADHVIRRTQAWQRAVRRAIAVAAASENLVTVGLKPERAATGFGYIEAGRERRLGGVRVSEVAAFVEKPDLATAERYLKDGRHFWNLSMFAFKTAVFRAELERLGRRHLAGARRTLDARAQGDEPRAQRIYARLPVAAIDYTVMERSKRLVMVRADFGWTDIGSWSDLARLRRPDRRGNRSLGEAVFLDSEGMFVVSASRPVVTLGVRDLTVVDTEDALLILPADRSQEVKAVVEHLRRHGWSRIL